MSDSLMDAVRRARSWPAESGARKALTQAAMQLMAKRQQEITDTAALLERQWQWLGRNGDPGGDAENERRYEDGMNRFLATLADYEDLCDGLDIARKECEALAA